MSHVTYATMMVHIDLGPTVGDRVRLAATLARKYGSILIGVAARPTSQVRHGTGEPAPSTCQSAEGERALADLRHAKAIFEQATAVADGSTFRSSISDATWYFSHQARGADLLVIGRSAEVDGDPGALGISAGALLMTSGCPTLIVPPNLERLDARRIVIAWKDTREARRAVRDALPFLKNADQVSLVSIGSNRSDSGMSEVASNLRRHGVEVVSRPIYSGHVSSDDIRGFVEQDRSDLLVMGAYGHNRAQEWAFGGMTRDMLKSTNVSCLMSH